jgi:hypothetical protein
MLLGPPLAETLFSDRDWTNVGLCQV